MRWTRPQLRFLSSLTLFCLALAIWILASHERSRIHHLSTELVHLPLQPLGKTDRLPSGKAKSMCRAHGFAHYESRKSERKLYDLVLMSTELDWLEIRLRTMANYVDYFVIIESPTTFTGIPKPLHLRDNWMLFEDFHHMIIYRVVQDPVESQRIWDHEDYLRNALFEMVFPSLVHTTQQANPGDVLIVSDMDEIVRPGAVLLLRNCRIPARLKLRAQFYYYSFQWRHRGPQWAHPDVTTFQGSETIMPNDLRQNLLGRGWAPVVVIRRWWDRGTLWNAAWHCSSCFATVAEVRAKMESFSHQKWNTAANRKSHTLVNRVRHGLDLFDRKTELYDRVEDNEDTPPFMLEENRRTGRFGYLLSRDGQNAGFEDAETVDG